MKYLTQFLFIIALSSCLQSESIEESGNTFSKTDKKYTIEFYDTLNLSEPDYIEHTDFDGNYFVSIEAPDKSILVHNKKGKLVSKISRYGDGPEEYKKVQAVGLNSFNNSVIVVTKKGKVIEYSLSGKFIRSSRIDIKDIYISSAAYSRLNAITKDKIVIATGINNAMFNSLEYFKETKNLSIFDIQTGNTTHFAPYEGGSIYLDKVYPNMVYPIFSFNYGNNSEILLTYPYDLRVLRYDLATGRLNYSFKTFPNYFGKTKGSKKYEPTAQIKLLQENSFYLTLSTDGETVLLFYLAAQSKDVPIALSGVGVAQNTNNRRRYMEIYNINGKKLSRDIELPKGVAPFRMFSKDKILFMRTFAPANNNEDEGNVLYWGRLVEQ